MQRLWGAFTRPGHCLARTSTDFAAQARRWEAAQHLFLQVQGDPSVSFFWFFVLSTSRLEIRCNRPKPDLQVLGAALRASGSWRQVGKPTKFDPKSCHFMSGYAFVGQLEV